jgi:hypothetical protein
MAVARRRAGLSAAKDSFCIFLILPAKLARAKRLEGFR